MSLGGIIGQTPDLNEYLPKSGGTMTGPLVLSGNPNGNLEAASKQYVDSKASEWKEIESITKYFTQLNKGDYSEEFSFSNLFEQNNLKIVSNWNIKVHYSGPSYGSVSITAIDPLNIATHAFYLGKEFPTVNLSLSEQIVLSNYYHINDSRSNTILRKEFYTSSPVTNNNYLLKTYDSEPTTFYAGFNISVGGDSSININNSTCTITVYGKN